MTLEEFNALPRQEAVAALLAYCSAPRWAGVVADARPFADVTALLGAADAALAPADLDEGMAGHPRIGDRAANGHSAREQSGVGDDVRAALAAGNREYEARFGHVYLVCASDRSGPELLAMLRSRLGNDPATEREIALRELAKINRIRLGSLT